MGIMQGAWWNLPPPIEYGIAQDKATASKNQSWDSRGPRAPPIRFQNEASLGVFFVALVCFLLLSSWCVFSAAVALMCFLLLLIWCVLSLLLPWCAFCCCCLAAADHKNELYIRSRLVLQIEFWARNLQKRILTPPWSGPACW